MRELANGRRTILAWDCSRGVYAGANQTDDCAFLTLETKLSAAEAAAVLAQVAAPSTASTTETMGPTALAVLQVASNQCFEHDHALVACLLSGRRKPTSGSPSPRASKSWTIYSEADCSVGSSLKSVRTAMDSARMKEPLLLIDLRGSYC